MLAKLFSRTKRDPETDCLLYTGCKDGFGYGMVFYQKRSRRVHRVVLSIITDEPIDTKKVAMHKCDTPACLNPEHLSWGTIAENNTDRHNKGRNGDFSGEKNPSARLTWEDVAVIRSRPLSISKMAKQFSVSVTHIKRILKGTSWNER